MSDAEFKKLRFQRISAKQMQYRILPVRTPDQSTVLLFYCSIVLITINVLNNSERLKNSCGLAFALRYLPQPADTQLHFGQLFLETRLSRSMNSLCRSSLKESLSRTVNLSKLVLTSKCSNDILETLGKNCFKLKDLYISLSEMVTGDGRWDRMASS